MTTLTDVDKLVGKDVEVSGDRGTVIDVGQSGIQDLVVVEFEENTVRYAKDGFASGIENGSVVVVDE